MLIHGRLLVTHNGLLLDEVRSLLQKSLRREELQLAFKATKELIGHGKDQLPWKSLVTFMFEDHCLTDANALANFYKCYQKQNKYEAIELLSKCHTDRIAACLQAVAIDDSCGPNDSMWLPSLPLDPCLVGLVSKENGRIDCDLLIAHIVKYWQEQNTKALTTLCLLVNMAAKVENRKLTSKGASYLLQTSVRSPTFYHLVLSVLYKHTTDEYMKKYIRACCNLSVVKDVPLGLIVFSTLAQLMYKEEVQKHPVQDADNFGQIDWSIVGVLETMPSWVVDKHTFRGKFGRETKHLFLKKFKNIQLTEVQLEEFHGVRPKTDINFFFDEGCICTNGLLPENPFWEKTKQMYLKQTKTMQKAAKMTKLCYEELRRTKSDVFCKKVGGDVQPLAQTAKKRKGGMVASEKRAKVPKLESTDGARDTTDKSEPSTSSVSVGEAKKQMKRPDASHDVKAPSGPLLQLPTGSAKVYTRLDKSSGKVWKGPYKTEQRQNLCLFYHKAMTDVFGDVHTLQTEKHGMYIIFPLLKSQTAEMKSTFRAFYDCIAKTSVPETDGEFLTREALGITQLHRVPVEKIKDIPMTVWAHFAFRYVLNIGDTGLYNAITADDYRFIYGIDMEESRKHVLKNDVTNYMFGKLPKREVVGEIEKCIRLQKERLIQIVGREFDFEKLRDLTDKYGVNLDLDICRKRLQAFSDAVAKL